MSSDRLAIIGDPIAHSLSPVMHNAALRAAGLDGAYEAHRVTRRELSQHVTFLKREGFRGFNVTIPHKVAIRNLVDSVDTRAEQVGAINTVEVAGGALRGHNTDVHGFRRALRALDAETAGLEALVFGSGGAARAVVYVLNELECRVTVVSRNGRRAVQMADTFRESSIKPNGPIRVQSWDGAQVGAVQASADLLINATPLGQGELTAQSPLREDAPLKPNARVLDLVYGTETPFLRTAREMGCRCSDGLEMLVQQAAESFRIWMQTDPDLAVMKAACEQVLAGGQCFDS